MVMKIERTTLCLKEIALLILEPEKFRPHLQDVHLMGIQPKPRVRLDSPNASWSVSPASAFFYVPEAPSDESQADLI